MSQSVVVETRTEDVELLRRFVEQDDRAAMGQLFARHADGAFRLALRVSRHAADAEDAVQAAFFEVLRHAAKFRGESSVRSWIFGFVVNACRHKAREEGRRAAREQKASKPETAPDGGDLPSTVRQAVRTLPEHYRLPVWLYYCEGLSSVEVAETLGLSENTVRSQLSRGVEELRMSLAGVSAGTVLAVLPAAAVETAPAALTASLGSLAAGGVPAAAGLAAKASAAAVALAALAGTALALWGGVPSDVPPPELAWVEERLKEWEPTAEERVWDRVAWAPSLREALRRSKETGRPVAAVTVVGPIHVGRSDGGSLSLRAGPIADPRVIEGLNARFIPVCYRSNETPEDPEEAAERREVMREASKAGLVAGSETVYFLEAGTGRPLESIHMCTVKAQGLLDRIAAFGAPPGPPVYAPAPKNAPPAFAPGALALHATVRYLGRQGSKYSYHAFPAEEWIVLEAASALALTRPGEVDPAVAARLFERLYPVTGNFKGPSANTLLDARLVATPVSPRWVRLDGHLRMRHPFFPGKDEREVELDLLGFVERDPQSGRPVAVRMASRRGLYGTEPIAVAVKSPKS
ncbi:MAG TPA: RNA polymerase sigma factor [Planctomycetota bacterium]|nr:RNA polymerase sigma factor [Planctomycetota bacterium]